LKNYCYCAKGGTFIDDYTPNKFCELRVRSHVGETPHYQEKEKKGKKKKRVFSVVFGQKEEKEKKRSTIQ
jgi:hypothetical protein